MNDTHRERVREASGPGYNLYCATQRVFSLISFMSEEWVLKLDADKAIKADLETFQDMFSIVIDTLYNALTDWSLETGDNDDPRANHYLARAEQYRTFNQVTELQDKVFKAVRGKTDVKSKLIEMERIKLANKTDAEAIPALQELLKMAQ